MTRPTPAPLPTTARRVVIQSKRPRATTVETWTLDVPAHLISAQREPGDALTWINHKDVQVVRVMRQPEVESEGDWERLDVRVLDGPPPAAPFAVHVTPDGDEGHLFTFDQSTQSGRVVHAEDTDEELAERVTNAECDAALWQAALAYRAAHRDG